MKIAGFAINADAARVDGSPDALREELNYYAGLGFTHVEIAPHGAGAMFNGRLNKERMKGLLALLAGYPFRYVVHGPNPMNLMNMEALAVEKRMFVSTIEFTAALGAGVMVYHAGRFLPEEKFLLPGAEMPALETQKAMLDMERSLLGEMGDLAAQYGVTIAVENARPFLDASHYCYGEFLDQLGNVIREINHPRVGITLDLGHAYLAARHYHFDLLAGVEAVAPYVRHIHLHDNFGKICASYEKKQAEMAAVGRGDMHMPIGWGEIPAGDALARLDDFNGVITLEMRPRYSTFYGEALANARALVYGKGKQGDGSLASLGNRKQENRPPASPDLVVRPASINDLPDIMFLYRDLDGAYGHTTAGSEAEQEKLWEQVNADPRQRILVGVKDQRIIGTLTVIIIPNLGHRGSPWAAVENVVVNGNFRGRGVGARLMTEAGRIAREHGCYKIVLTSNLSRRDAHNFYSRLGWRMTHAGFSLEPTV